jgi:hypothetical protein
MLDECCHVTGYHRKHVVRRLAPCTPRISDEASAWRPA